MCAAVDWLLGGVLERHPGLNVILSEGGSGWIPYIIERSDKVFFDRRLDTNLEIGQKFKGKVPPSQLFRDHMYVCLVDERFAVRVLGDIGSDNLVWEADFPHGDGLWPDNRPVMEKTLAEVPDDDAVKIMESNLRRVLHV
jgi:predicted TIM-barrel fold metal-dependent hydrolase